MSTKKPESPIKASTQDFIEITAVSEDVVLMKDNSCCVILQAGTTNFGLLSEEEQRSLIYSFASMLNSLSFPVQILILSKRMDISSYLDFLQDKVATQQNETMKNRLAAYTDFIKNIVKKNTILEKNFYFIIPFSPLELGVAGTKKKIDQTYIFSRAKTSLYPKRDHLMRLMRKTGLGGKVLVDQEIAEIFYNLYNPSANGRKLAPINSYSDVILTS